jgi:hypothetical protein
LTGPQLFVATLNREGVNSSQAAGDGRDLTRAPLCAPKKVWIAETMLLAKT